MGRGCGWGWRRATTDQGVGVEVSRTLGGLTVAWRVVPEVCRQGVPEARLGRGRGTGRARHGGDRGNGGGAHSGRLWGGVGNQSRGVGRSRRLVREPRKEGGVAALLRRECCGGRTPLGLDGGHARLSL